MITFIVSVVLLILGFIFYGKVVERHFGADPKRETPVKRLADGVDYKELKPWKIFIIQFLNIAGLGPIFGAILGAAYGPMAYLWIVAGCIFMGSVHDYCSGMLSLRNDGISLPNVVGKYLGKTVKVIMTILTAFLLLAVGTSFVKGPADLLHALTSWNSSIWLYIIFAYYIIATLLPIDKIIGNIYPIFGVILIFMVLSVGTAMLVKAGQGSVHMTEFTAGAFHNYHASPSSNVLFPMLFIVISCGAISGFHATQSPLMARCMGSEKYGRPIFYGAMILEGIVAMVWASAAMAYYGSPEGLNVAACKGVTPAILVNLICNTWLGKFGAVLSILGVVVCPITSGDTAFRSLRLVISDVFKVKQKPIINRLIIAVPI
ncbi:MAG: carbon starvation protein A, partial [Bacteroidales bacterium]|nr:carbon starvation protein A [Bacteroidales bacterium]